MSDTSESGWDCWVVRERDKPSDAKPTWRSHHEDAGLAAESAVFAAHNQALTLLDWEGIECCDVWMRAYDTRDEPVVYTVNFDLELHAHRGVRRKP